MLLPRGLKRFGANCEGVVAGAMAMAGGSLTTRTMTEECIKYLTMAIPW